MVIVFFLKKKKKKKNTQVCIFLPCWPGQRLAWSQDQIPFQKDLCSSYVPAKMNVSYESGQPRNYYTAHKTLKLYDLMFSESNFSDLDNLFEKA